MGLKRNNLAAIRRGLKGATARGTHRAAGYVAELAAQLAPEDEGDLKRSIQVDTGPDETRQVVSAGRGLPDERAVINEYGGISINYPAQPYMTPASRAIEPKREVAQELRDLYKANSV